MTSTLTKAIGAVAIGSALTLGAAAARRSPRRWYGGELRMVVGGKIPSYDAHINPVRHDPPDRPFCTADPDQPG